MHQNTPFQVKNSLFWGWGIAPSPDPFPDGKGYAPPHTSPLTVLDPPCVPSEFQPYLRHWRYVDPGK